MKQRLLEWWNKSKEGAFSLAQRVMPEMLAPYGNRERAVVYSIATVIALALWGYVNLNREFIIDVQSSISIESIPQDLSLSSPIPEFVNLKVSGEGWQLISLYNNPPQARINLDQRLQQVVDLELLLNAEMKKSGDLNVVEISQNNIEVVLSKKLSKRVPIVPDLDIAYKAQHYPIGGLELSPDSVRITGPSELISTIDFIPTAPSTLSEVSEDINLRLGLSAHPMIELSQQVVRLQLPVRAFTEAKVEVPVSILNLPNGVNVQYQPSVVEIRFDVPLEAYNKWGSEPPFLAQIDFTELQTNQGGYITPTIVRKKAYERFVYKDHYPKRVRFYFQE